MEIVVKEVGFGEPCSKVNIRFSVAVFVWDKEPPTAGFKIFHGGTEIYKRVALWVLKRIIRSDKSHRNRRLRHTIAASDDVYASVSVPCRTITPSYFSVSTASNLFISFS